MHHTMHVLYAPGYGRLQSFQGYRKLETIHDVDSHLVSKQLY